jgi:hypothetical protein
MRTLKFLALLLTVVVSISSTAVAKPKKNQGDGPQGFRKITDVNAVSVTVSVGTDGNSHETYTINDSTKVTLNGVPSNARELKAGMVAKIDLSSDGKIAVTIVAKDPPAHPAGHRVG